MTIIQSVDRNLHRLYRLCGYLAAAFVVLIGVLVLINITSRLLGVFVPGMTEGAGYSMAGAGALGLAYTFGEHGHIRVSMLIENLRGRFRFGLELWALAAATGLVCYLAFYLVRMVHVSYLFEDRSDGSDALLIWIPQAPTALGFAVFALSLVHALIVAIVTGTIETRETAKPEPGNGEHD
jgi:TRAP-type C4-dicarboxylate transport system permease small subunit